MPTLSVKLPDETKQRLNRLALAQGVTAHALMVNAIEASLTGAQNRQSFVAQALLARKKALASGQVMEGNAFSGYLKSKVRAGKASRPGSVGIDSLISTSSSK